MWRLFWHLSGHRIERNLLPPSILIDHATLHGIRYAKWEVKAIEAMDRMYCRTLAEETKSNDERRKAIAAALKKG